MAFPVVQTADTKTGLVTSNSASWTLTYPTNLASGNLIFACCAFDGLPSCIWPSGWVKKVQGQGGIGSANSVGLAAKISDGTETGNFTLSLGAAEQGAWRIFRITGWYGGSLGTDSTNDADGLRYEGSVTGSPSTTPNPPANNPANWDVLDTLWFAAISVDTSRTISVWPLANLNTSDVSGGAGGATLGLCSKNDAVASLDPGTFTISSSDDWVAYTVAVRPSSGTTYNQAAGGTLTFAGAETRQTNKAVAGALSFAGVPIRQTSKLPAGVLSFAGVPAKVTVKSAFTGALGFGGALGTAAVFAKALAGTLAFAGDFGKTVLKALSGSLSLSGDPAKLASVTRSGALSFIGTATKTVSRGIAGALSFGGVVGAVSFFTKAVSGALSFAGSLVTAATFARTVSGVLSFVGARTKVTLHMASGALSFIGDAARVTARAVGAALSFGGATSTAAVFTKTVAGQAGFSGTESGTFIPGGNPPPETPASIRRGSRRDAF